MVLGRDCGLAFKLLIVCTNVHEILSRGRGGCLLADRGPATCEHACRGLNNEYYYSPALGHSCSLVFSVIIYSKKTSQALKA